MEPTGLLPRAAVIEPVARSAGAERRGKLRAARHGVPACFVNGSARALHRSRILFLYAPPPPLEGSDDSTSGDGARNRVRLRVMYHGPSYCCYRLRPTRDGCR